MTEPPRCPLGALSKIIGVPWLPGALLLMLVHKVCSLSSGNYSRDSCPAGGLGVPRGSRVSDSYGRVPMNPKAAGP